MKINIKPGDTHILILPDGTELSVEQTQDDFTICCNDDILVSIATSDAAKMIDGIIPIPEGSFTQMRIMCVPGNHLGPTVEEKEGKIITNKGWRLVPANFIGTEWVYDLKSGMRINVCPCHAVRNEPGIN